MNLWDHQKIGIDRAKVRDNFALFYETGTGKTATAINILAEWNKNNCLTSTKKILKTLVLCPPIIIRQWREEFVKYSNLAAFCVILEGTGKKRLKTMLENEGNNKIFIANYETLLMKDVFSEFQKAKLDVLICDESHKFKNPKAKRTKSVILLAEKIKKKIIMTGTPVLNSPMDLFSQFLVLDGGKTFGKNFFVFRAMYFYDKNAGMTKFNYFPDWRARPGMEEQISELISKNSMRVKKEECLDLPALVKVEVSVEMSSEQKRVYTDMEEDLLAFLSDGSVATASLALTKVLRLQQIVSGFVSQEDIEGNVAGVKKFEDVPRVAALEEILEDIVPHHKVIVWACFQHNYEQISGVCERLGVKYVEITGQRSETQKREAVESFRSDASIRVCIANQKAGGVGLNLIEASYSVYYSRSYSLEDDIQSEARNYRGGSERHTKVTRIDLVTPGSVDEIVLAALKQKQNLAEKILDLKKMLRQK